MTRKSQHDPLQSWTVGSKMHGHEVGSLLARVTQNIHSERQVDA